MSESQSVITVDHLHKSFKLPHEKTTSIKSFFTTIGKKRKKNYGTQHALKDISFRVDKGDFFGIVGRNGSGKSTLLKLLAEIYQPTSGSVSVIGRLVPFIELGVGFNPELTGRENVYLSGALSGFSRKEIDEMYKDIVDFAELGPFMDQKLKNYSSGMQVRLAFSVATRAKADILLIDEVLAVGDADFQRKCFEYFKRLKKDKKTVVFVSHDMAAVREYCDKAILIDDSKLVFSGSSEEVAKEYTKLFLPEVYEAEQRDKEKELRSKDAKWGSGGVDITDLSTSKAVYMPDSDTVVISYKVVGADGFEDTINPGFTIKDEQGQPVCGTNTNIALGKRQRIVINSKNKVITIKWSVPNIFNAGKYTIDPAVLSASNGDTLQWWDEAGSFRVVNSKSTPYPVTPPIAIEIS